MPPVSQVIDAFWHCLWPPPIISVNQCTSLRRSIPWNAPKSAFQAAVKHRTLHCASFHGPHKNVYSCRAQKFYDGYHTATAQNADNKDGEVLRTISKSAVYEELRKASTKGDFERVQRIVRTLVEERGELPNSRIYTALILANTSPYHGTAAGLAELLAEMVGEGIMPDSATYHAVLKVKSIEIIPQLP